MVSPAEPHLFELAAPPDQALEALSSAAEVWGAEWRRMGRGGRLLLPVTAGLRYGFLVGEIETASAGDAGTRISYRVEHAEYELHRASVAVLLFGGIGAFLTILAPLYPTQLWQLVPFGLLLMVVSWLLVISRVRHRSVEDFFRLHREILENENADEEREMPEADKVL